MKARDRERRFRAEVLCSLLYVGKAGYSHLNLIAVVKLLEYVRCCYLCFRYKKCVTLKGSFSGLGNH